MIVESCFPYSSGFAIFEMGATINSRLAQVWRGWGLVRKDKVTRHQFR